MSELICVNCHQSVNICCEKPNNLLEGLKNPKSNNTVYQYALPNQSQLTPVICQVCYSKVSPHYPKDALCYVCEQTQIQERYEFVVSFAYMKLNVHTLLCSSKCRAVHEIFARTDLKENGGHLQIITDPNLALEIETEIRKIQTL